MARERSCRRFLMRCPNRSKWSGSRAGTISSQEDFAQMRATAREIFLQALGECGVADAITCNVEVSRGLLRVCEDLYDLRTYSRIFVVAIGKASRGMAEALQHQMGSGLAGIV